MHMANLNGIRLHYDRSDSDASAADAPIVVFANSLGTDYRVWDKLIGKLAGKIHWVRYDKRGHGLSESAPQPYVMEDHISDIAALMDHLGITNAVICGLSVGGMIAQGLAASRPDLIGGLILMDTAHIIGDADTWNDRIKAVNESGIEPLADATMERWFSDRFHRDHGDEMLAWRNMLTRTPVDGYAGTGAAIRDCDLTARTQTITKPTVCIGGEEDGATPPALMRQLTALIDGAVFHEIAGTGHLPCVEAPGAVAAIISDFLNSLD